MVKFVGFSSEALVLLQYFHLQEKSDFSNDVAVTCCDLNVNQLYDVDCVGSDFVPDLNQYYKLHTVCTISIYFDCI